MTTVEEHAATTVADFYQLHQWLKCGCGWEGTSWRTDLGGTDREAMAEWAAHVHVALGLAVREEDEGLTEREMDEERAADEEAEQGWKEERP